MKIDQRTSRKTLKLSYSTQN